MQDMLRTTALVRALLAALAIVLGSMPASTSVVRAQDAAATAQARARFAEGVRLYARGDWARALDAFRLAYAARPHPSVLVNIANCYVQLGRPTQAIAHFTRYLTETGDGVAPEQRVEIEQALAEARASAATLSITASPEGAMVFVDGDQVGRAPLTEPVALDPGPHVVELRSEDGASTTVRVTVSRGEQASLRISGTQAPVAAPVPEALPATTAAATPTRGPLVAPPAWRPPGAETTRAAPRTSTAERAAATPADPSSSPEPEAPGAEPSFLERVPVASWIVGGAGVALLAVGTGFGVAALSSQSDFDDVAARIAAEDYASAEELQTLQARGRSASDAQSRDAVLSDVALGLGLVGIATAVTLFVIDAGPARSDRAAAPRRRRAQRSPRLDATPLPSGAFVGVSGAL